MQTISKHMHFDGILGYYRHASKVTGTEMRFSAFVPPQAEDGPCPAVFFLSGVSCTEENFTTKAGAYRLAAELGMVVVVPDTSPRGDNVPSDDDAGLGKGAGFYVDATQDPWKDHYRMDTYITQELRELVIKSFPVDGHRLGIFGHSMGGHGALSLYLRNPKLYQSVSAFAPICSPIQSPWGMQVLQAYLGSDRETWKAYDATELMRNFKPGKESPTILIDQGTEDQFLNLSLKPHLFVDACEKVDYPIELRLQKGYDHGYFFVQTFVEDHLLHHAAYLGLDV